MSNLGNLSRPEQAPQLSLHRLRNAIAALKHEADPGLTKEAPPPKTIQPATTALRARRLPEVAIFDAETGRPHLTRRTLIDDLDGYRKVLGLLSTEHHKAQKGSPEKSRLYKEISWTIDTIEERKFRLNATFLPQHSPAQLISPQLLLMSPLFAPRSNRDARAANTELLLNSSTETPITYLGPELRQSDGLVFMALLNIARDVRLGQSVSFDPRDLCVALESTYGGPARARLQQTIFRLQSAVVKFPTFSVQLVMRFNFPPRGTWSVAIDSQIVQLFSASRLVWLDLDKRLALPEGLVTWLYGYIQCQTRLIPQKTENLRTLCGSTATPRDFSTLLQRAVRVLVAEGLVDTGWSVNKGIVRWRKPAASAVTP